LTKVCGSGVPTTSTEDAVGAVFQVLEDLGHRIIPATVQADVAYIQSFERVVAQWNANSTVEASDVNGAQVLQALASEGWVIVPPAV